MRGGREPSALPPLAALHCLASFTSPLLVFALPPPPGEEPEAFPCCPGPESGGFSGWPIADMPVIYKNCALPSQI